MVTAKQKNQSHSTNRNYCPIRMKELIISFDVCSFRYDVKHLTNSLVINQMKTPSTLKPDLNTILLVVKKRGLRACVSTTFEHNVLSFFFRFLLRAFCCCLNELFNSIELIQLIYSTSSTHDFVCPNSERWGEWSGSIDFVLVVVFFFSVVHEQITNAKYRFETLYCKSSWISHTNIHHKEMDLALSLSLFLLFWGIFVAY